MFAKKKEQLQPKVIVQVYLLLTFYNVSIVAFEQIFAW